MAAAAGGEGGSHQRPAGREGARGVEMTAMKQYGGQQVWAPRRTALGRPHMSAQLDNYIHALSGPLDRPPVIPMGDFASSLAYLRQDTEVSTRAQGVRMIELFLTEL